MPIFTSFLARQTPALVGLWIVFQTTPIVAQQAEEGLFKAIEIISSERMLADVRTLSGPSFNGRQTGTEDDLRSARWVAQEFLSAGLRLPKVYNGSLVIPGSSGKDGATTGIMAALVAAPLLAPDPMLQIGTVDGLSTVALGTEYLPIFDAPSVDLHGQIVFVGYGIVDPSQGIDDYAGVDVHNRIVLFLRGKPDYVKHPISHADKVRLARERGALAYLTATGPILHLYEARRGVTGSPGAFYGQLPLDQAIPGAWISTTLAERILADSNHAAPDRLLTLQEELNRNPSSRSIITNHYASLRWNTETQDGALTNVLGVLPGTGPDWIIIGAHRDHFGKPAGLLFPGADDNASGTAVILEVARALIKAGFHPRRSVLFVSFSGEERDLLGSRLYTSRPLVPLAATKAMINIDHAGIGNGRLTVGVTNLDKRIALDAGTAAGLQDRLDLFGFFPGGDHVPFKEAGVPTVTVVSSGVHPHFHQPTDTADTLDPDILRNVARYVLTLAWRLADEP
ncbi:M28 family peptidase [Candidatus Nitrospira inopinata]|uniref:Putative Peptidase, M28 family n=1 Tax=Candidatus Nitrospira inopinata TaxID=1715989 RepID=A0A0S4L0E9_9BACT|nr:M28 family peptidase [Candidatus Nitrospira inopinata]CUQ68235.1 putative Peptidase, M28 family [Candidatus Nitrospira inopinata]